MNLPRLSLGALVLGLLASTGWSAEAAKPNASRIVSFDEAKASRHDWGEFRRYFGGQTDGTLKVLTAMATVEPGKAVHKAHRHAEEEYLILVEGEGTWSLEGKTSPAKKGDILYTAPWAYHGLVNTGSKPLVFVVVRYTPKGVAVPPRPDTRPDEMP